MVFVAQKRRGIFSAGSKRVSYKEGGGKKSPSFCEGAAVGFYSKTKGPIAGQRRGE